MEKPKNLTLKKYWEAKTSTKRSEIVKNAFSYIEKLEEQSKLFGVNRSLPSDKEIESKVLDVIDKNLQCGTGDIEGILCNRFATVSFIRDYIKSLW